MSRLIEQLKKHEGLELKPYHDTEGVLTVGYGRNLSEGITEEEAEILLMNDIEKAAKEAEKLPFFDSLNMARKAVIINMLFNLGLPRFLGFKKTIAAIEAQDFKAAAAEMLDSKWAQQVGARAEELAQQMKWGKWSV